ncbi:hypothetical protein MHO82_03255 [Vibrio sp. Of7-15]|uniref:hypothetical protein n=1 Tax=Vibrio sp. Of7-15 TaxID=2724879 RepID=UPI001EF17EFE|nr:hypothetical protein [Vibrio sp. Of7-15]MCG7495868.1 hypothetical protein [Vibrio sp. Of7-15]
MLNSASKLAKRDTFLIDGQEYKGLRQGKRLRITVPEGESPLSVGDEVIALEGHQKIVLQVVDLEERPSLEMSECLLMITAQPVNSDAVVSPKRPAALATTSLGVQASAFDPLSSASLSSALDSFSVNMDKKETLTVANLIEAIDKSGDEEAKQLVAALLENGTVAKLLN